MRAFVSVAALLTVISSALFASTAPLGAAAEVGTIAAATRDFSAGSVTVLLASSGLHRIACTTVDLPTLDFSPEVDAAARAESHCCKSARSNLFPQPLPELVGVVAPILGEISNYRSEIQSTDPTWITYC
ncbi:hypothetical protein JOM56_010331 [Amanita muscaria]